MLRFCEPQAPSTWLAPGAPGSPAASRCRCASATRQSASSCVAQCCVTCASDAGAWHRPGERCILCSRRPRRNCLLRKAIASLHVPLRIVMSPAPRCKTVCRQLAHVVEDAGTSVVLATERHAEQIQPIAAAAGAAMQARRCAKDPVAL